MPHDSVSPGPAWPARIVRAGPLVAALVWVAAAPVWAQPVPGASACPEGPRRYEILRQEEHWDALADPACRADYADRAKYIPVGSVGFATLGGQVRSEGEWFENAALDPDADDAYVLQRTMLHAAVQLGDRDAGLAGRGFVQLKSGLTPGAQDPSPVDRDALDLGQAFAEVSVAWGEAVSRLTARLGRTEFHYGAGRLVTAREGPTVRSSYDGVQLRMEVGRGALSGWTADAFAARPNTTESGVFDNGLTSGAGLWGVYATGPVATGHALDVYVLGYTRDAEFYHQGPADETRHTVGARWTASRGAWTSDVEAGVQVGRAQPVDSTGAAVGPAGDVWAGYASAFGTLDLPGPVSVGFQTGLNSGDGDASDPGLGTFRAPYPPGRYFGAAAPLGPSNLMGAAPLLTVAPLRGLSVTASSYLFWRASTADGTYGVPGSPVRPAGTGGDRFVGWTQELLARYVVDAHLDVVARLARFAPGGALRDGSPTVPVVYTAAQVTYTF